MKEITEEQFNSFIQRFNATSHSCPMCGCKEFDFIGLSTEDVLTCDNKGCIGNGHGVPATLDTMSVCCSRCGAVYRYRL